MKLAATLILNDDVDGAESGLSTGTSSFHNVGIINTSYDVAHTLRKGADS